MRDFRIPQPTEDIVPPPSLARLERLVLDRSHREALAVLLAMLDAIDARRGGLGDLDITDILSDGSEEDYALVFCTRLAAAIGRLLSAPDLELDPAEFEQLLIHHRWVDTVFSLSGFRGADPFVSLLASQTDGGGMTFPRDSLRRLLAMLSLHSPLAAEFETLWQVDRPAATLALLHYLGARAIFQSGAAVVRERLLEWLPGRLGELRLGGLTLERLQETYMHCSYAFTPAKHAIKGPLIAQMRRACLEAGCVEWQAGGPRRPEERPTVVVVVEHLRVGHSVFRTHGRAVAGLRERFHVVGVFQHGLVDDASEALFDECIHIPRGNFLAAVRHTARAIVERAPALVFHLGVGMTSHTIALASLRLAPVQCTSFGHTSTTMSPAIDYMILPEDFAGTSEVHSEKVVTVPLEAMPYAPIRQAMPPRAAPDGTVRIAVAASAMKLNPALFDVFARIENAAKAPVEFHFLSLGAAGLAYVQLVRAVRARLKSAVVFPESSHETYMERLARCDFFLSPFPYGNMNSLFDAFQVGLPGVCLDGAEPHAHADVAIFARAGLPAALSTTTIDGYVAAALRLIDDSTWREHCRDVVGAADLDRLFGGAPEVFAAAIAGLIAPL